MPISDVTYILPRLAHNKIYITTCRYIGRYTSCSLDSSQYIGPRHTQPSIQSTLHCCLVTPPLDWIQLTQSESEKMALAHLSRLNTETKLFTNKTQTDTGTSTHTKLSVPIWICLRWIIQTHASEAHSSCSCRYSILYFVNLITKVPTLVSFAY
jgi:hypothetical protein